jgi:hypothetical protein
MQPTAVCQSLSHRRTHAEAHAHAHTSAGVAGAPRVFKACTQSGVRVRAGAHVCVCVRGSARVQRLRTHANVCAPAGCVPPLAGMQTSEPLHGFFPPPFLSPCGAFRFSAGLALARLAATCGTIETTSVILATSHDRHCAIAKRASRAQKQPPHGFRASVHACARHEAEPCAWESNE